MTENEQFDCNGKSKEEIDSAVKEAEKKRWKIRIKVPKTHQLMVDM